VGLALCGADAGASMVPSLPKVALTRLFIGVSASVTFEPLMRHRGLLASAVAGSDL